MPGKLHFLLLPLEIRDIIYGILCETVDDTPSPIWMRKADPQSRSYWDPEFVKYISKYDFRNPKYSIPWVYVATENDKYKEDGWEFLGACPSYFLLPVLQISSQIRTEFLEFIGRQGNKERYKDSLMSYTLDVIHGAPGNNTKAFASWKSCPLPPQYYPSLQNLNVFVSWPTKLHDTPFHTRRELLYVLNAIFHEGVKFGYTSEDDSDWLSPRREAERRKRMLPFIDKLHIKIMLWSLTEDGEKIVRPISANLLRQFRERVVRDMGLPELFHGRVREFSVSFVQSDTRFSVVMESPSAEKKKLYGFDARGSVGYWGHATAAYKLKHGGEESRDPIIFRPPEAETWKLCNDNR